MSKIKNTDDESCISVVKLYFISYKGIDIFIFEKTSEFSVILDSLNSKLLVSPLNKWIQNWHNSIIT